MGFVHSTAGMPTRRILTAIWPADKPFKGFTNELCPLNSRLSIRKYMKWTITLVAGSMLCAFCDVAAPKKILVVTVTKGFRHSSIPTAEKIIGELAADSKAFKVDYARVEPTDPQFKGPDGKPDKAKVDEAIQKVLAEKMSPKALKKLDGIIFANTT